MEPIIEVKDLYHRYPSGVLALQGVDIAIDHGEFVAIIGQNGSGKTTFVKHLNGLLRPTSGSVVVDGHDVPKRRVSDMARVVGYCFQNPDHQIFCDTVHKEVAYGPRNLHLTDEEIEERVEEALTAVRLGHLKDRQPRDLSKGQRQRLAVASVLSMRPKVLIVDEPTTGQDYRDGLEMLNLAQQLNESGHTILIITHDMQMVARFARRVIVFRAGKTLLDGPTRQVFSQTEALHSTFLAPPQITTLAQHLPGGCGEAVLSVEELVERTICLLEEREAEVRPS